MPVSADKVRAIALGFDGASEGKNASSGQVGYSVNGRGFAWTYSGRVEPKKPRVLFPDILAVCCSLESKAMLIEAAPDIYFEDDHYRGYPAVLVRLKKVKVSEFTALLERAYQMQAAKPATRKRAKKKR